MIARGTMIPLKKILGVILLLAGAGLIFIPDQIVPFLCSNKLIFGVVLIICGYFLAKSGTYS